MSKLYVVSTPIGNLGDITFRAVETLKAVDLIACEDTRVSKKLLDHYQIKTKTVSYHQHSSSAKTNFIVDFLKTGKNVALIADAGTPGISDPGNKLIAEIIIRLGDRCEVVSVPGASAVIAALSISGLPTDRFWFLGFMPHKKGRETLMKKIADSKETSVFYESTHRILKTLALMKKFIGTDRKIVVCREITKKFETVYRGNLETVTQQLENDKVKGEFVVIIGGK